MKYELTDNEVILIKSVIISRISEVGANSEEHYNVMLENNMEEVLEDFIYDNNAKVVMNLYNKNASLLVKDIIQLVKKLK